MGKIISNGINYSGIIHEYSPAIYSTEEREIGVWIDGKPLYKKVVVFSESIQVTYTSIFDTTIDSSDIENIITAVGIHADGTNYAGMLADPTRSNHTIIGLQTGRNDTYANVKKLILEYTKISDSPGSGTWTPSGVPAVHYSTEEQVVGTWMNKPLYQRTFTLSSATVDKSNSVSIPNDLENIKRVFLCDSSVYDVTDNRYYPLPYRRKTTSEDLFISLMRLSSETVSIQIVTNQSSSYILQDIAVTIRYTKTTD